MKKLSVKLGILFFTIIFGLMSAMFFFLHKGIVGSIVEEQLSSLQARGNSHREILNEHFDKETIDHVILMESEAITDVVITNEIGIVKGASSLPKRFEKYLHAVPTTIPYQGLTIEDDWEKEDFIATISPVQSNNETVGYIYMFQNTSSIQTLIHRLNNHFFVAGWFSIVLTVVVIFFLSKGITKPLIKMKEATSELSKGNFSVSLPKTSEDELGDLATSISKLALDLDHLTKERNNFLASISHELRTPLTYIKGYADIVNKRDLPKEEREKYLSIIVDETNRLSDLVKELFELAKIDENTFKIQKELIHLENYFNRLKQKFTPAFQEKGIELFINCESTISLEADPLRLEQILFNLLDNALKYSSIGSAIYLEGKKTKDAVQIAIRDNGKGIPERDLPHIFKRFYRVDKSRTRSLGGTGLGLSIVKELVAAHGAEITVTSKENSGTTFVIIFPGGQIL